LSLILDQYVKVAGHDVIEHLKQLAKPLQGLKLVHINSTRIGGGVAEILYKIVPLLNELGINTSWQIIEGDTEFYQCTKNFHNALQGNRIEIPESQLKIYQKTNETNYEKLKTALKDSDIVFVHDPQPVALIKHLPEHKGKWIWRCHIDLSKPFRPVWKYLRNYVNDYDASIFSLSNFAQQLSHPVYLIAPSIDPMHEKNIELQKKEVEEIYNRFDIDPDRPMILQVSRFDRFKDPIGVIHAYRSAKRFVPLLQLVLAGGGASDDPEGDVVLEEVRQAASDDPDIKILLLPSDAHRTINALQRAATIIMQKSIKEGFGLTVTEALWKGKPVIGGDTGGIRIQVINHHTGFLVNTPEGAALRIRYLLQNPVIMEEMSHKAKEFVRENLTLILAILHGKKDRIELSN
jgi:trehalose synthase